MPKPMATPPMVMDSISTLISSANPRGFSKSWISPMLTAGSSVMLGVSLVVSTSRMKFRWPVGTRWQLSLLEESFVDIASQFFRAVRKGRGRPASFHCLTWSTMMATRCLWPSAPLPRESRRTSRRDRSRHCVRTYRKNDSGTTTNMSTGVRNCAARRNCQGKSLESLPALLPAITEMMKTARNTAPSPRQRRSNMAARGEHTDLGRAGL
mmetsp:Transcript_5863/g.17120  ORF Transcript_5863/g.17120 Transcript_5863/m.17120 type:complete len:210 (-) Transcript_5863:24-653(-)